MDEIILTIGKESAASLVKALGGTSFYIGKSPTDAVINAIGYQAGLKLSHVYDGNMLYIPNAKAASMALRNQAIKSDRVAGLNIRDLVAKYGLSDRRIFSICE